MRRFAYACALLLSCSQNVQTADPTLQNPQSGAAMPPAEASAGTAATLDDTSGVAGSSDAAGGGAGTPATMQEAAGVAAASGSGGGGGDSGVSGASSAAQVAQVAQVTGAGAGGMSGEPAAAGGMAAGTGGPTAGTAGGSLGIGGMSASATPEVQGCPGSTLLELPQDTSMRGPWPIGIKTVQFGRFSNVELFYPAQPGSEQGQPEVEYDMRLFLPERERQKIPDAEASIVKARTYRDLPIDAEHGPYPVMIFVHGTASFRLRSLSSATLWASRGFVVMAGDHPNLYLADYLGSNGCGLSVPALDLNGDVDAEVAALSEFKGGLAFLDGHIDMQRVALAGHSAGAYNVAQFTSKPGVQVVIALAGTRAVSASPTLKSVLYVAGLEDSVLPYGPGGAGLGSILYPGSDTDAYNRSPGPSAVKKRLVGIAEGGHLNVVDGCAKNAMNKTGIEVAEDHGVCGASSVAPLANCGRVDANLAISITNEVMTAVLEETLQCQDRAGWISELPSRHPEVADFHEAVD